MTLGSPRSWSCPGRRSRLAAAAHTPTRAGGDRRGVDAHAALAVVAGLVVEHRVRREAQRVERPDEVDGDDGLEGLELVRSARAGDALGPADAGAVHRDAQPAVGLRGLLDG